MNLITWLVAMFVYTCLYFEKKKCLGSILIGMGQNNMENDAMEYPQCGVTIDCNAFHVYYVYFTKQFNYANFEQYC